MSNPHQDHVYADACEEQKSLISALTLQQDNPSLTGALTVTYKLCTYVLLSFTVDEVFTDTMLQQGPHFTDSALLM